MIGLRIGLDMSTFNKVTMMKFGVRVRGPGTPSPRLNL